MSGSTETSVADDQLTDFIDRILRMKEEADAIAADIREIYAEAKANGFDKTQLGNVVTYLRKKDKDAAKLEEGEAVFDLYLGSYLATKNRAPRVRAYARASNGPEITEPQPAPQAESDLTDPKPSGQVATNPEAKASEDGGATVQHIGSVDDSVTGDASRASDGAGSVAPIQPETANEFGGDTADVSNPNNGGENEDAAEPAVEPLCRPQFDVIENSSEDRTHEVEVATTSAQIVTGEGAHNASVTPFTPKPLRPYCLNPGTTCGGMGKKHCWKCQKAHDEAQGAA